MDKIPTESEAIRNLQGVIREHFVNTNLPISEEIERQMARVYVEDLKRELKAAETPAGR